MKPKHFFGLLLLFGMAPAVDGAGDFCDKSNAGAATVTDGETGVPNVVAIGDVSV